MEACREGFTGAVIGLKYTGPVYRRSMEITIESLQVLNDLRDDIVETATRNGFRDLLRQSMTEEQWNGPLGKMVQAAVMTANQHGEASEFWESFRAGTLNQPCDKAEKMESLGLPALTSGEEEIADEIIRALDKAQAHGIDVAKAVYGKAMYNKSRPFRHGNKNA